MNYSMSINDNICNITTINCTICQLDILKVLGYSPLFLLGLLLNCAALRAFIATRHSWTDTHIFMLNLNIADFFFILFLVFRICDAVFCLDKSDLCTFLILMYFLNMYVSIFTTTAISVQRYLIIRFPMHARSWRRKKRVAFAVCLAIWVFVIMACAIFRKDNNPGKLWRCFERCKNIPLRSWAVMSVVVLGFVSPLLIIVFCSSQIIRKFLKEAVKSEEKKNIVSIVTANMIVFIVCYTPIHVAFVADLFDTLPQNWMCEKFPMHTYLLASEWIASTNCCFDSISYYFLLKGFYSKASDS